LGQCRLLGNVVLAVQLAHVLRDDHALGVLPGALTDPVAGIHRAGSLGAEVRVPVLAAGGARGLGAQLADLVRALEATEIAALARAGAGDEEAHSALLGLPGRRSAEA